MEELQEVDKVLPDNCVCNGTRRVLIEKEVDGVKYEFLLCRDEGQIILSRCQKCYDLKL